MVLEVLVQPSGPCLLPEESRTSLRQVVAFDKINHHRMFEALERMNIPPKMLRIINKLCIETLPFNFSMMSSLRKKTFSNVV
jgi:hypothetical protein